jgi:hypothetical protein
VLSLAYEEKIKEWTHKSTLTLLYRGSRDGFGALNFHTKCDNKVTKRNYRDITPGC